MGFLCAGRPRTMRLDPNDLTGRACIPVLPNHIFDMTFRYYDPVTEDFAESRRLGVRSGSCLPDAGERCSPGNASCIPVTCTNLCDPTDRGGACIVELHPPRFGCVTGSLVTGSGDPIDGVLRAFVNGNMVGEVLLPTAGTCDTGAGVCAADDVECASSFCTRVPIGSSLGAQVELRDGVGNSVSFIPTPPTAGAPAPMCPASRPAACGAPTTACEDLGTIAAACDEEGPIPQRCMRARFTWQAEENTASCPGAGNFEVSFDGSASSGDISYFEWRLQSVWLDESGPTWSTCLPEGRYLVTMLTVGSGRELRARGVAQNIVDVRPRPCRSTYDGLVAPLTTSITCTYGDSTRDCLASDGRRTLVTYADKPCGWPCLSGNPFELASTGLAFDPINRPWSEVAVTTSLGTSRLENLLDDFGNVVSSTAYDVNGVAGVPVTYAYDDPARPMRIEVMSPGAPTTTFTLGWDGPRLQSWGLPPGFVTGVVEYGYDGNRLSQVEWRNAQGVREALVPFTYDGDSVTMSWIRRDTEQARVTYDFACP